MKYLFDTNVWIDAIAGRLPADTFLKFVVQAEWVGYSAITRLELFGFPDLTEPEEEKLAELLKHFVEVGVDSSTVDKAITIRKATRIKVPDAIIAATAIIKECSLITRNMEDFKGISGLNIINPYGS